MTAPLFQISHASVAYGKIEAVRDVSLAMPKGSIVTVIGANGAGKTTLLSSAMGLLSGAGEVRLDGERIDDLPVERRVARGLSLVPERRDLFNTMTVEDNLVLGAFRWRGRPEAKGGLDEVFARFPRLKERRTQIAGTLSGGERQMLAMGRALMGRPRVLMLDEPSLGLAPRIVKDIFRIIVDLRETGVSILLVEQNARAALQVADHAYVMELGRITLEGKAADLAKDDRVIESYLGLGRSEGE